MRLLLLTQLVAAAEPLLPVVADQLWALALGMLLCYVVLVIMLLRSALDLHHWEVAHLVVATVLEQLLPVGAVALLLLLQVAQPLLLLAFAHQLWALPVVLLVDVQSLPAVAVADQLWALALGMLL